VSASSIALTNEGRKAKLADFSCAVVHSGDDDFDCMIANSLPPYIVAPEVQYFAFQLILFQHTV
jgi:hypothetical protein